MGVPIRELMKDLPKERQERIKKMSERYIKEYKGLIDFRKAIGLTQKDLAGRMAITQENVSRLEKREDMHLSTLRKYVEALGGELELLIKIPGKELPDSIGTLKI